MRTVSLFLLATSLLFGLSEEVPSPLAGKYMTGNWDGWRDRFEERGVVFTSSFITELVGNPTGGRAQGFTYTGSYGLELDVDFDKACGWKGFGFFTSMAWRTGSSLTAEKIGNQFPVQEIFGGQTVKLNELYFKESLFDGWLFFKTGRMNPGNDFLVSPLYCNFLNLAFCGNPVSILYNTAFTVYPFAEWGAYLHFKPHEMLLVKGAVYNANTEILKNKYHGVNFTFNSTNGVIWIAEANFLINQKAGDRYPGSYRAGFFYQTANTVIFSGGLGGDPGYYFQIDQMIYKGVTPFMAMVFQPKDRNLLPLFISGGVVFKGMWGRPADAISAALAYGRFSPDLGTGQDFETVIEANYWYQATRWLSIVPDLQYIIHPKGTDTPNAFCLGLQMEFTL